MADITTAVLAAFAAIGVAYATQFIAEDFRRFRDGSALAARIAGELNSYKDGIPLLRMALQTWIGAVKTGKRADLKFRPFERPVDLYFNEIVGKLGLLGRETVESVVYVYSNLRAFRVALEIISVHHADMSDVELQMRCETCLQALERAASRGEPLVSELQARAESAFRPRLPWGNA